ncbi:hypothetical protein MTO96_032596 [Rhipicephalus appendiculatus]
MKTMLASQEDEVSVLKNHMRRTARLTLPFTRRTRELATTSRGLANRLALVLPPACCFRDAEKNGNEAALAKHQVCCHRQRKEHSYEKRAASGQTKKEERHSETRTTEANSGSLNGEKAPLKTPWDEGAAKSSTTSMCAVP